MKATHNTKATFADLPVAYAALCRLHLPRPIHDQADYDNTAEVAVRFAGFEAKMNTDQNDYFELLARLMEEWEKKTVKWPKQSPLKRLKHLLDQHEMNGADLSRVLGGSRLLGPMILRGDRSITADHARSLGKYFGLSAGSFIE